VVSKASSAVAGVTALVLVTLGALIAGPASAAAPASHAVITFRYIPAGAGLASSPASAMSAVSPAASVPGCPNPMKVGDLPCAIPGAHHCIQVAKDSDGGVNAQAVFCVDLIIALAPGSTTTIEVALQISGYCQDAAGYRRCPQVVARGVTSDPTYHPDDFDWQKNCGDIGLPYESLCAAHDKNYFSHDYVAISHGYYDEVWGVLWATSSITLSNTYPPTAGFIQTNFETGHWIVSNGI
jgi:hypothetical protein